MQQLLKFRTTTVENDLDGRKPEDRQTDRGFPSDDGMPIAPRNEQGISRFDADISSLCTGKRFAFNELFVEPGDVDVAQRCPQSYFRETYKCLD